ncbi:hypothetical protein [Polaromonas sp. CG_9.7]|nr:hypothetical protein [Polaromonas sp. CG_9.7]MBG6114946.1 hypothetical protein [Polaromonas sp. CG_9.2]MDH6183668.1 hypothetical protein [Polaromonas sp. CG_23.6]
MPSLMLHHFPRAAGTAQRQLQKSKNETGLQKVKKVSKCNISQSTQGLHGPDTGIYRRHAMIYMKTQHGQSAFKCRAVLLTPRQRSAFILFDGKRDLEEVMRATAGLGVSSEDIGHLVAHGLLAPCNVAVQVSVIATAPDGMLGFQAEAPSTFLAKAATEGSYSVPSSPDEEGLSIATARAQYSRAYPIATRLTASLGLRGFLLNLAVEGATNLAKLQELAPKIKTAIGPEKFMELQSALYD